MIKEVRRKIYLFRYAYLRDIKNKLLYGPQAPKTAELIWVNSNDCNYAFLGKDNHYDPRKYSGRVITETFLNNQINILELPKIKYCYERWINGKSWEEAGAYDYMLRLLKLYGKADNCKNIDDVKRRYDNLDEIFLTIKKEGRLRTKKEIDRKSFRENQGILININENGEPLFGGGGNHRFAMAKILKITFPAQVGYVHKEGIKYLNNYRKNIKT